MTTASIPESIVIHEKMFRHQLRVLFLKTSFSRSPGDQEPYRANLIALLDHAYTELMSMAEAVKTYPQPEAMRDLEAADNLKWLIAELHATLEKSDFLNSEQVDAAVGRTIHGVFKFALRMRTRAYSNQKRERRGEPSALVKAICEKSKGVLAEILYGNKSA
jgi:hypothetical protein